MRRIAMLTGSLIAGLVCAGCSTMGTVTDSGLSGAGYSYSAGRATQDFAYPTATIVSASAEAMGDLRIHSIQQVRDAGMIMLEGTTADNRRATVAIRPNKAASMVSVRVGWFGDPALSRALMDRVGIRLGTLPPTAAPVEPPSAPESNPFFSKKAIPDSQMLRDQTDAESRDSPVP
jgi:hypothetical protein